MNCFSAMTIPLIALMFSGTLASRDPAQSVSTQEKPSTLRVLFLGNSHTSVNNVTGLVKLIGEADGETKIATQTISGGFLETIAKNKSARATIKNGHWDVVVMQGQKISMSGKYLYSTKEAVELSKLANDSGARVIFYSEWGRRGVKGETERTQKIYLAIAQQNNDTVCPVGECWESAFKKRPNLKLHASDGNHANILGATLTAFALSTAITEKDCQTFPDVKLKRVNDDLESFFRQVVSERFAIRHVFDIDNQLGKTRNTECKTKSLAETIKNYVSGMKKLDFAKCPKPFSQAFEIHIQAWEDSIPFFETQNELRGEMHDLFEEIRAKEGKSKLRLEEIEKQIWGTWSDVEVASR